MRVLIAEDDEGIATITSFILEENGHTSFRVKDEKGFEKSIDDNIDLVLLDVSLGSASGQSIAKKYKKDKKYAHIPLVLMSAHHDLKSIAKDSKADDYITKPFEIETLLSVVNKYQQIHT